MSQCTLSTTIIKKFEDHKQQQQKRKMKVETHFQISIKIYER
jgi:hypothetical protein